MRRKLRGQSIQSMSGDSMRNLPLLPLRDIIVFPHMVVPLFVGRAKSIKSLEEAMADNKEVLLAAQKDAKLNEPKPKDIFAIGTIGTIIQLLRLPDGTVKVLIEGKRRAKIESFEETEALFRVSVSDRYRSQTTTGLSSKLWLLVRRNSSKSM